MSEIFYYILYAIFILFGAVITVKLIKKKSKLVIENIICYLLFTGFVLFKYLWRFPMQHILIILIMLTIFGHTYLGNLLNYYNRSKTFDRYLHVFGSFSFALFVYRLIQLFLNPVISPKLYSALFVFTLGVVLGAISDILEFLHDALFKSKKQKGLIDTDFDLIVDLTGAAAAGIVAYYYLV